MKKAFTLIELLIVVAIIAILAAIAVPNFLEAQVRAKVSRMKSDMRSIATGLEAYVVDNNKYPFGRPFTFPDPGNGIANWGIGLLSTPIAYMTNPLIRDVFIPANATSVMDDSGTPISALPPLEKYTPAVQYSARGLNPSGGQTDAGLGFSATTPRKVEWWYLQSFGPDSDSDPMSTQVRDNNIPGVCDSIYDPTNGTVSNGNVYRVGGPPLKEAGRLLVTATSK